ncbi:hypothetical protein LUZ62_036392 [Rhynchospora pubera]|uniref:glucan endo-1,3-beta-D-glucosidase n=1 Tax=Rhynchospora pubera TaxID=906938 RepID=A0AAV8F218_9POAL|nr:hypothetical protein LUZ62_057969 [Rhynchospora pubera]KAJ4778274.1 hypothetical protein LUZ62_062531 [Rhynchospora pubera]KAJ4785146.1 hypothetical protein LUZ62_036392 [Rhynchospora pubera]
MLTLSSLLSLFLLFTPQVTGAGIGVNYGKMATDLPSPFQVAQFLSQNTIFDRVKILDSDPPTIEAFANTRLAIDVTISNDLIPNLINISFAKHWIRTNIIPYASSTNISRILVGNEAISTANKTLVLGLVPAMQNLHTELVSVSLHHRIKVSTAHSLGILAASIPPSAGKFKDGYDTEVIKPMLSFLKATNSPFMVNAYPFFGFTIDTLDYALFRLNNGVFDNETGLVYTNMLDAQLDAVHSAMKRLGFTDINIVIAQTGWPSVGGESEVGVSMDFARDYNKNLIRHVISGIGTPLMSDRTFETYIFELFNEDLKPGPSSDRNFGLFHADLTPVYDIGILKPEASQPVKSAVANPADPIPANVKQWCIPKPNTDKMMLQGNIDFACSEVNCHPIQPGGNCFNPDTLHAHAAYAMNEYFQFYGKNSFDCYFGGTGIVSTVDPSYGSCKFRS